MPYYNTLTPVGVCQDEELVFHVANLYVFSIGVLFLATVPKHILTLPSFSAKIQVIQIFRKTIYT